MNVGSDHTANISNN